MRKHKPIHNLGHYAHPAKVNYAKTPAKQTVSADPKLIGPKRAGDKKPPSPMSKIGKKKG